MAPRPPRQRTSGIGEAPKVRRSEAAEKPARHRCESCKRVGPGRIKAFYGRETEVWMCQDCLERAGQGALFSGSSDG